MLKAYSLFFNDWNNKQFCQYVDRANKNEENLDSNQRIPLIFW